MSKLANHSQLLSSLTQLQHLRSLRFEISKSWESQSQFYEELGDQLGSKLVHLEIRASSNVQTLDLLSNQMFKFSILKTLRLDIDSRDFNLSLKIESIFIIVNLIRCYLHVNSIGWFEMQKSLLWKFLFHLFYYSSSLI